MNILWFILVGAAAGWLASLVVKGSGLGFIGNLITGICGGVLGGFLADEFGISVNIGSSLLNKLVVATAGSVILLFVINLLKKRS